MPDIWFHATPEGGRIGPMRAGHPARLFQAGRIRAAVPVWRAAITGRAPLSSAGIVPGLPSTPPPLPARCAGTFPGRNLPAGRRA